MNDYKAYIASLQPFSGQIEIAHDEPMARHTTFRIGGPADIFLKPLTQAAMAQALAQAYAQEIPCTVIGNGSNLLVRDEGVRGVVLCTEGLNECEAEGNIISAGAGLLLARLARKALEESLTGLEFAAGIPGTVGGGIFMNAGAYGGEMCQIVLETSYVDETGAAHTIGAAAQQFGYRTSIFKEHPEWVITGCKVGLSEAPKAEIAAQMEDLAQRRREKQPIEMPSAGSTFKRPEGMFAGKLIEDAGLKGLTVGGAQVSPKHAGFIVNRGGASCQDVQKLIEEVQKEVLKQFGVMLECEVRLI